MFNIRKVCFIFSFIILFTCLFADNGLSEGYDTGDSFLKDIQIELNMVRSNPVNYATSFLIPRLQRFRGKTYTNDEGKKILTKEGASAFEECIQALKNKKPMGALIMEKGLCLAAQFLADDHARTGEVGHTASDGSNPQNRMERYGFLNGGGENWICGSNTARDIVIFLLVDDGIPSRGHRKNILKEEFRKVGIGFSNQHKVYGSSCVMDFAVDYISDRSMSLKHIKDLEEFQNEELSPGYSEVDEFIKEMQKEINMARSNPYLYATTYIAPIVSRFDGNSRLNYNDDFLITNEGVAAVKDCIEVCKNTASLPPLSLEKGLCLSAQELADDLAVTGKKSSKTSKGRDAGMRMQEYGKVIHVWKESSWYGLAKIRDIVVSMLIDDGVKKKSHRAALLNPKFTKIGIGFSDKHKTYGTVAIMDFAGDYESF